ncbi:ABC transporter permease [Bengtsoniella intestinalis]|uniref:ABC transporter permease n=1 Tax=Bengtsoniella intestinalis TaxID=3073143 RepID=UPI00391FA12F
MTTILIAALEAGFLYAPVAMALFLSYSILDIADLTTDGSFTLGAAVSAVVCLAGHPILALPMAMVTCAVAGGVTAVLQTKLGVPSILAGIITNIGLYSINIMVMGSSNKSIFQVDTIYTLFATTGIANSKLVLVGLIVVCAAALLIAFLGTRLGLSIRATGDNIHMMQASSVNPAFTITVGLCMANAMTGLSGAMVAQYSKSADVNMGTGMVVIGLAALIIGETLIGKGSMVRQCLAVVLGSILYRVLYALALRANVPAEYMKLVTAIIVGSAIAAPTVKAYIAFQKSKRMAIAKRRNPPC